MDCHACKLPKKTGLPLVWVPGTPRSDRPLRARSCASAQQALPPPEQLFPPSVLRLGADEHLAPDIVLHVPLHGGPSVCLDLHGAEAAQLRLLLLVQLGGALDLDDRVLLRR